MTESNLTSWAAPIAVMRLDAFTAALPKLNPSYLSEIAKAAASVDLALGQYRGGSEAISAGLQAPLSASATSYAGLDTSPSTWKGVARALESLQTQYQGQLSVVSEAIQRALACAPLIPGEGGVDVGLTSITSIRELTHLTSVIIHSTSSEASQAIVFAKSAISEWIPLQDISSFPPSSMVPSGIQRVLADQQKEIYALANLLQAIEAQHITDVISSDLWANIWADLKWMLFGSVVAVNYCALLIRTIISCRAISDNSRTRLFNCYLCSVDAPRGPPWVFASPWFGHQGPAFRRV